MYAICLDNSKNDVFPFCIIKLPDDNFKDGVFYFKYYKLVSSIFYTSDLQHAKVVFESLAIKVKQKRLRRVHKYHKEYIKGNVKKRALQGAVKNYNNFEILKEVVTLDDNIPITELEFFNENAESYWAIWKEYIYSTYTTTNITDGGFV